MYKLARLLNELTALLTRDYLSRSQKLSLLFRYYGMKIRYALVARTVHDVRFMGFRVTVSSFSNFVGIVREVFIFGDYYFKARTAAPVILDCGANIGTTTLFFKWLYPKARITAFEPSPRAVAALRKNVMQNNLEDVEIVEAAASDSEEPISFWEQPNKPGGSTAVREVFETKATTTDFEEVRVKAVKLSSYVSEPVDLLKMDIEGGEGIVIQELANAGVLTRIKTIIMEFHESQTNSQNSVTVMIDTLKQHGFHIVVYASEVTPSSEKMAKWPAHHFLLRADRS